ncbi:MAG: hypothetical protein HC881_11200 [Leptolyngbyaceae cyanobacterium SL_7_1]|nr:hypothetical protein [Leptolyngbyaceae cyanobacterium SL_7_1]
MDNKTGQRTYHPTSREVVNPITAEFDFDEWAVQVKRQLLAALQKRGR